MEVNAQNIQQLGVYLQQTLSPQNEVRKPAEEFLQSVEGNQNYPILLLNLLQSDSVDVTIKVKVHILCNQHHTNKLFWDMYSNLK